MKDIAMAWVGDTMKGHGAAVCYACGWVNRSQNYGKVALAALAHEQWHAAGGAS